MSQTGHWAWALGAHGPVRPMGLRPKAAQVQIWAIFLAPGSQMNPKGTDGPKRKYGPNEIGPGPKSEPRAPKGFLGTKNLPKTAPGFKKSVGTCGALLFTHVLKTCV